MSQSSQGLRGAAPFGPLSLGCCCLMLLPGHHACDSPTPSPPPTTRTPPRRPPSLSPGPCFPRPQKKYMFTFFYSNLSIEKNEKMMIPPKPKPLESLGVMADAMMGSSAREEETMREHVTLTRARGEGRGGRRCRWRRTRERDARARARERERAESGGRAGGEGRTEARASGAHRDARGGRTRAKKPKLTRKVRVSERVSE